MKQAILFLIIASIIAGGAWAYSALNPEPPRDYKIVYFGAGDCGGCVYWKRNALPEWKKTKAGRGMRLVMQETMTLGQLNDKAFPAEAEAWKAVRAKTRGVPSFALIDLSSNKVTGVYMGAKGWRQLEKRASRAYERHQNARARHAQTGQSALVLR